MKHCIYFHHKPNGEIFYVGQSKRIQGRPQSERCRTKKWWAVVREFGYYVAIIHKDLTREQANMLEAHYVKDIGRLKDNTGTLVNVFDGGESVRYEFTDEVLAKMRLKQLGKKHTLSDAAKAKMSEIKKRQGYRPSQQAFDNALKTNTGRKKTPGELEKLRLTHLGKPKSDESRRRMSEGMIKAHGTKVIAVKDCAIYEFDSMKEAEETLQRQRKTIRTAAAKGFNCNGFRIYL